MAGPGGHFGPRGFLTEEEKQNMPRVTGALIRRILSYLKPYWVQFTLVFVTILLSSVVGLLPSIITGRIVDEALIGRNMQLLIQLLLMALATLAVSQAAATTTTGKKKKTSSTSNKKKTSTTGKKTTSTAKKTSSTSKKTTTKK